MHKQLQLPFDEDAEKVVLGYILLQPDTFLGISQDIEQQDFCLEKHKRIYSAMVAVNGAGSDPDPVTVGLYLDKRKELEAIPDGLSLSYLAGLESQSIGVTPNSIKGFKDILKTKTLLRKMFSVCSDITDRCEDGRDTPEELLASLRACTTEVERAAYADKSSPYKKPDEVVEEAGGINAMIASKNQGIRLPFDRLNEFTGGLHNGEMTILAARPSLGKTALALQIAEFAASNGITSAIASLEMPSSDLLIRLAAMKSKVNSRNIKLGTANLQERCSFVAAMQEMSDQGKLFFCDHTWYKTDALRSQLLQLKAKENLGLVVLDYLQLMPGGDKNRNRAEVVSEITRNLKLINMELDIPFLLLSQLNRDSERDKREPKLSDLRESGSIEQDANNVWFIHHSDEVRYRTVRPCRVIIAKQRSGFVGKIDFVFHAEYTRFEEQKVQADAA